MLQIMIFFSFSGEPPVKHLPAHHWEEPTGMESNLTKEHDSHCYQGHQRLQRSWGHSPLTLPAWALSPVSSARDVTVGSSNQPHSDNANPNYSHQPERHAHRVTTTQGFPSQSTGLACYGQGTSVPWSAFSLGSGCVPTQPPPYHTSYDCYFQLPGTTSSQFPRVGLQLS